MIARLLLGLTVAFAVAAAPAPAVKLHIGARARRHILSEHFPGGGRTAGKSLFGKGEDLDALVAAAASAPPERERNGRDKRVFDAGRVIGSDGRSGKPVHTVVVIAEPDGEVVTAYPGR